MFLKKRKNIFAKQLAQGKQAEKKWNTKLANYAKKYPKLAQEFTSIHERRIEQKVGMKIFRNFLQMQKAWQLVMLLEKSCKQLILIFQVLLVDRLI